MAPVDSIRFLEQGPLGAAVPIVIDSPHSGMIWPEDFLPSAPRAAILTTWDAFVDELWSAAPTAGASLLSARFPRAYVDVNRAVDDIDPALLAEPWPSPLTPSDYTARGMGLIRRDALPGVPMYDRKLSIAEVRHRIDACYAPYRTALAERIETVRTEFGAVWHINAHSMKSRGNAMNVDSGVARPDFVVSDRRGTTADPSHTAWIAEWLRARGHVVQVNDPYLGGDLVRTHGSPATGRHSIQIEINRALYMTEATFARGARFGEIRALCGELVRALAARVIAGTRAGAKS